jgi:NADH-quinone oxidoreductase subunit E
MITDEEKKAIEAGIHEGEPRRIAVSDALSIVQKRTGWISDEEVIEIASFLEMTPAEVDSIATFYNLIFRRPVGRHVILICDSVSCYVMDYKKIKAHLEKRLGVPLGQTSSDNRFTWLPVACLGHCEIAPVFMIDGKIFGNLNEEKVDQILSEYP